MSQVIKADSRTESGKGASRRLRNENKIPAILYGAKKEAQSLALNGHDILLAMNAGRFFTNIHELEVDGKKEKVLARDIQRHPVSDAVLHIDLLRFDPKQKLTVSVNVRVVDEDQSPGILKGGVLQLVRTDIELVCRADNIPEEIVVSMAGKDIGDSAHISEIELPEGAENALDRDFTIASVVGTRTSTMSEDTEDAEGEETAEGEDGEAVEGEDGADAEKGEGEKSDK